MHDVDIFWQLALGAQGGWIDAEPFLATKRGEPMVPAYWLGQVALAKVHAIGGWRLLTIIDAGMWLGGFVLAARSQHGGAKITAVSLALGFVTAIAFQSLRPQSFAVLLFGLMTRMAAKPSWRLIILLAPLLVLWQNLHPSVLVAAGYLATLTLTGGCHWPKFAAATLVAGLAVFATPAGAAILTLSANNAAMSTWLRTPEWLPLWSAENIRTDAAGAWVGLAAFAGTVAVRRSRLSGATLMPAAAFAVLTLLSFRFAVFFGLTLIPMLVDAWQRDDDRDPIPLRDWLVGMAAVAGMFAFMPVRFDLSFPFATIDELKANGPAGPVYCHRAWGSIVSGHAPGCYPSHDGRMYLFTRAEWQAYADAAAGRVPVADLERQFHPTAWLLRPGFDDGLIELLNRESNWRTVTMESSAILVLRKRTSRPDGRLER
jgi:hypothetical protein